MNTKEYFTKAEEKELEKLSERMKREKKGWLKLVDLPTWQILRILAYGKQHVRGLARLFSGSRTTLQDRLDKMVKWGLIQTAEEKNWPFRKDYEITALGERLLSAFDQVGEVAKEIRGEKEAPIEKTNL